MWSDCLFDVQVLDEIGVDVAVAAPRAAGKKVASKASVAADAEAEDEDLDALTSRLANLKS